MQSTYSPERNQEMLQGMLDEMEEAGLIKPLSITTTPETIAAVIEHLEKESNYDN